MLNNIDPSNNSRSLEISALPGGHLAVEHLHDLVIEPMRFSDLELLFDKLTKVPELAMLPAEQALLAGMIDRQDGVLLVARQGPDLIGALIGGSFGVRGTVSHLWVDAEYRGQQIGQQLFEYAYDCFRKLGVPRLHVMVTPGNEGAVRFWRNAGFEERPEEYFLERDVV